MLKNNMKDFCKSKEGHVAVFFAFLAVPILTISSLAIDSHRVDAERMRLSNALDSAALAAVTHQNLTADERDIYAREVFWSNIEDDSSRIKLDVLESDGSRVTLEASTSLDATFALFDQSNTLSIFDQSSAEVTYGNVICMLALDPSGERSFEITGGAKLKAPTCSVQVNSLNSKAAIMDHGGEALAQDFCVAGGAMGDFKPHINTECRPIEDPFVAKRVGFVEDCKNKGEINQTLGAWQAEVTGVTLTPGTYCGGINLYGKVVTFAPGTYVIKDGPLVFDYGTVVTAVDVTFVFQGQNASLMANEGSRAYIKAPEDGEYAGMAFFQDVHTDMKNFRSLPTNESIIKRGSDMNVIGIAYLPEQKISFVGGSLLENQAPATSFIGYQISIGDGSDVTVAVDHQTAGIPPIEPRSDESARLTR